MFTLRAIRSFVLSLKLRHFIVVLLSFAAIISVASVIYQLSYPSGLVMPFAKLNGTNIGKMSRSELVEHMRREYDEAKLNVKTGEKTTETTLAKAGLTPDYAGIEQQAFRQDGAKRFIPFYAVVKSSRQNIPVTVLADDERLDSFVTELVAQCRVEAVDARVRVQNGTVELEPAKTGHRCESGQVKTELKALRVQAQTTVSVQTSQVAPKRTDADVQPLFDRAAAISTEPFYLAIIAESQQVPQATVASWIVFTEDAEGKLAIGLDEAKITAYLKEREKAIYIAPGTSTVTLTDGVEESRKVAYSGQGIDVPVTIGRIKEVLLASDDKDTAYAGLTVIPPQISYVRNYSKTQKGLDALLRDLAAEKGNYGIAVRVLSGKYQGLNSSANGTRSYITASTYKLFVAYAVLKEQEAGRLNWGEIISDSRNAEQCFEDMIVKSDNPCAKAFAVRIGWATVQSQMHALGLTSTYLAKAPTFDNFSTALDEVLFVAKLESGELLQGESRDRLLSAMKRQIYRSGIPAGTGVTVADKVGFLYGLLHDASIVYGPNGTYALVILTDGSSWGQIADTAKRIQAFLNQ
jgi:beta-lactamase class A